MDLSLATDHLPVPFGVPKDLIKNTHTTALLHNYVSAVINFHLIRKANYKVEVIQMHASIEKDGNFVN